MAGDGVEGCGNTLSSSGVFGRNLPTFNYGGLGSQTAGAFGVYGDFGTYGYLGTGSEGVYGKHNVSGNYGRLGHLSYGVQGVAASADSVGVDGPHIPSGHHGQLGTANEGAIGVHGPSGNYGQLGTVNYGAYGINNAAQNDGRLGDSIAGVRGVAAASSSTSAGVRGEHFTSGNFGQLGTAAEGVRGVCNGNGTGVRGESDTGIGLLSATSGDQAHPQLLLAQHNTNDSCRIKFINDHLIAAEPWYISMDKGYGPSLRFGFGSDNMVIDQIGNVSARAFNPTSDRNAKENFIPVVPSEVLEKVVALRISRWNFKEEKSIQHVGPMAQDFHAAFTVGLDDKHIATVNADGVALAAIQGLNEKLEGQLKSKEQEIQSLNLRLERLERTLARQTAISNN